MKPKRIATLPDAGGWHPSITAESRLQSWLRESDSLTARIVRACPAEAPFGLQLLAEGSDHALPDEALVIGATLRQRAQVREVLLRSGAVPLVFAHTVLVRDRHALRWLGGVGRRPLGSLLFTSPGVVRGPHHYRWLDPRHPLYRRAIPWADAPVRRLPARRALFRVAGVNLLVTEVFLPAILQFAAP